MTWLSDGALERLRDAAAWPDLAGTKYEALEAIGRGGMGAVYRVRDTVLGRDVAMKVLDAPEAGPSTARRLRREARILARLEHPGVVPVHDSGELADGRAYYVMKLVEGRRLDAFARETPDVAARLGVFERICDTIAFAHANGVLHRDLKPENVMVGGYGEVLVLDWGVAKALGDDPAPEPARDGVAPTGEATAHGTVLGTPGYMPPEQARGEAVDRRADVYALGAILRFLLGPEPPAPLAAVCAMAMADDPAARYADADALRRDVARYLQDAAVGAYRESPLERARRFGRRHKTAILLVLAYLAFRMLTIFFAGA
jgi:serine/threonine protein kinase